MGVWGRQDRTAAGMAVELVALARGGEAVESVVGAAHATHPRQVLLHTWVPA